MKRWVLFLLIASALLPGPALAGFLAGNSTPDFNGAGKFAFKLNSSILMVATPFSSVCLACKYGWSEKVSVYAKYGVGTIDYSTVSGRRLTSAPLVSIGGLEYLFSGTRSAEHYLVIAEYETVSWSINRTSNISTDIMVGMDYVPPKRGALGSRFRIAMNNFNAGLVSEKEIGSSTKYSLSTEVEYVFTDRITGCFEGGIYLGDKEGGLLSYFGLGMGYNL